jgi:3-hydroxy-9,10-secoandrosta-1,3,5(10)-triene-9,17-dione monooxygenase reductase component
VLAWLVCDLRELLPGGDHMIGIGEVVAMGHGEGEPLVWYRGSYTSPGSVSEETGQAP